MMTNGDHKRRIFLSQPHENSRFFFFAHHKIPHNMKKLQENPKVAEMLHGDVILTLQ